MRVGATRLVYPEKQMGEQLVKSILISSVLDQVTLVTWQIIANIKPRCDLIGQTLRESQIREKFKIAVIGIQPSKRSVNDCGELHEEIVLDAITGSDAIK